MSLTSLPRAILIHRIVPCLTGADVWRLTRTCKALYAHKEELVKRVTVHAAVSAMLKTKLQDKRWTFLCQLFGRIPNMVVTGSMILSLLEGSEHAAAPRLCKAEVRSATTPPTAKKRKREPEEKSEEAIIMAERPIWSANDLDLVAVVPSYTEGQSLIRSLKERGPDHVKHMPDEYIAAMTQKHYSDIHIMGHVCFHFPCDLPCTERKHIGDMCSHILVDLVVLVSTVPSDVLIPEYLNRFDVRLTQSAWTLKNFYSQGVTEIVHRQDVYAQLQEAREQCQKKWSERIGYTITRSQRRLNKYMQRGYDLRSPDELLEIELPLVEQRKRKCME